MQNQSAGFNGLMIAIAVIVVGLVLIIVQYNNFKYEVHTGFIHIINFQLKAAGYVFPEAESVRQKILQKSADEYTFKNINSQLNYAGGYFRWLVVPIIFFLCIFSNFKFGKVTRMKRKFDMWALTKELAKINYEIAPIANRGRSILEEPYDTGPWRTVRSPLQFAVENNLIQSEKDDVISPDLFFNDNGLPKDNLASLRQEKLFCLDREKATDIFGKQLGPKFTCIEDLPEYQKALAIAFMAFASEKKQMCEDILEQAARSFREKPGQKFSISIPGVHRLIKHFNWEEKCLQVHSEYTHTFFVALYLMAKKRGILTTSQFIWLRYADRTLFYALHQAARLPEGTFLFDSKWAEAAAVECHFLAEEKKQAAIEKPDIKLAINGLENFLVKDKVIFL